MTYDETFDYDGLGNLKSKNGEAFTYSTTKPHQATALGSLVSSMSYNHAGSRTNRTTDAETQVYLYDNFERLTRTQLCATPLGPCPDFIDYTYDFAERRVSKVVTTDESGVAPTLRYFNQYVESQNGQITKYYYAGGRLIASRDRTWTDLSEVPAGFVAPSEALLLPVFPPAVVGGFAFLILVLLVGPGPRTVRVRMAVAPSRAVGVVVIFFVSAWPTRALACGGGSPPPPVRHYHLDHLGSVQVISDEYGALQRQIRYRAYGEIRGYFDGANSPVVPTETTRHTFTGYEAEFQSGLEYAGARYFDPLLGQFMSHDPMGQYLSPYAYGPADPMNGSDPTGAEFQYMQYQGRWGWYEFDGGSVARGELCIEVAGSGACGGGSDGELGSTGYYGITADELRAMNEYSRDAAVRREAQRAATYEAYGINPTTGTPYWLEESLENLDQYIEDTVRVTIPGAAAWDAATANYEAGNYGQAALAAGVTLAQQGMFLATLGASQGISVTTKAAAAGGGQLLYRYREGYETATRLGRLAARAENQIQVHGVSVTTNPVPGRACGVACAQEVGKLFRVVKTGSDPYHFTVVLPKPVTKAVADAFNMLFRDGS